MIANVAGNLTGHPETQREMGLRQPGDYDTVLADLGPGRCAAGSSSSAAGYPPAQGPRPGLAAPRTAAREFRPPSPAWSSWAPAGLASQAG